MYIMEIAQPCNWTCKGKLPEVTLCISSVPRTSQSLVGAQRDGDILQNKRD